MGVNDKWFGQGAALAQGALGCPLLSRCPGTRGSSSHLLSLHRHCHRFSPFCLTPAKLTRFPKCPSAGASPCRRQEEFSSASACRAARGSAWEGRAVGSTWGMSAWAGAVGCPRPHGAEPWPTRLPDTPAWLLGRGHTAAGTACPVAPSHKEAH